MKDMEIMQQENQQALPMPADAGQAITQIAQAMQGLADMMRTTNDRMSALEQEVRLLTKVTPLQAREISATIRTRAAELCESYRAQGCEAAVANAIRREVRLMHGIQNVRELPRCEYPVVLQQVRIWDDYKAMKAIKGKGK